MILARRTAPDRVERLRRVFWPSIGWRRSLRYAWLRLRRFQGAPESIALGAAAGVFAAFVPLIGLQMLLAVLLAWALRANVLAAFAGTFIGTPLTYPLMWAASYRVGRELVALWEGLAGVLPLPSGPMWRRIIEEAGPEAAETFSKVFVPVAAGGAVLGLVAGVLAYYIVLRGVSDFQARRRDRIEAHSAAEAGLAALPHPQLLDQHAVR